LDPDVTPMTGFHVQAGTWQLMLNGKVFGQFLLETGNEHHRGHQAGSINWLMVMANRSFGEGRIGLRAMFSLEPWTIVGCGYPDLLATFERRAL
jgi:hypothetical protein